MLVLEACMCCKQVPADALPAGGAGCSRGVPVQAHVLPVEGGALERLLTHQAHALPCNNKHTLLSVFFYEGGLHRINNTH